MEKNCKQNSSQQIDISEESIQDQNRLECEYCKKIYKRCIINH